MNDFWNNVFSTLGFEETLVAGRPPFAPWLLPDGIGDAGTANMRLPLATIALQAQRLR